MKLARYSLVLVMCSMVLTSCNHKSLQKYLVEKQDDDKFMKVDIAASLLQNNTNNFSEEEKGILKTIKKVNVVAYPIHDGDTLDYEAQRSEIEKIRSDDKYKDLTRIKSNNWSATLKYTGDEDAINEVIVYARDDSKGFAVLRLLVDKMRPEQMMKLMKSVERGDLDVSKLSGLGEIFKD